MKGFSVYMDSVLLGYYDTISEVAKAIRGYGNYHDFDIFEIV